MIVRRLEYREGAVIAATGPDANQNRRSEVHPRLSRQGDKPVERAKDAQDQGTPQAVGKIEKFAEHVGPSTTNSPSDGAWEDDALK
jgi:hypothetical protein